MYNYYSYKRKRPIGLIITIIISTIIIGVTVFLIYKNITTPIPFERRLNENEALGEEVINIPQSEDVIFTSNCVLNVTEKYICGHNKFITSAVPDSFIGKNIKEIKKENTDYNIISHTDFSINAEKICNTVCDNHYIITLSKGKLISFNKNNQDMTIKETNINLNDYSQEDIEILTNGIEVGSKEEMLEFFEDFA